MTADSQDVSFDKLVKLYEAAVRDRELLADRLSLFKKLIDLSPAIMWTSDAMGSVNYANMRWTEITGASMDQSIGNQWLSYIDPQDRDRVVNSWSEAVKRGVPYETEYRILRVPDGEPRWHAVKAIPIKNEAGQVESWFGCNTDVHDLRLFKEELAKRVSQLSAINTEAESAKLLVAQSEAMFRTMCESSNQLMWIADAEGRANYFNSAFYSYTGANLEESRGDNWLGFVADEQRGQTRLAWHKAIEKGSAYEAEILLRRYDGQEHWHFVRAVPIKNESGKVSRWVGTAGDIELHRRMVSELEHARDKAESALAVKSEFVANVSHELRTPMNGILGMVQVLLRTQELNPTVKEYVLTIKEAGDALLGIINDLLDFSKAEAGKMELTNTEFDLLSLIEGVGDILVPQSANKGILLISSVESTLPRRVIGDPLRMRQILLNLAGNAVKFTDEGTVALKVRLVDTDPVSQKLTIRFSVCDTGIGLNEKQIPNLFEPFVQADGSSHRTATGTGLGLCICKRLVDLMHGDITVESAESQGSIFSVTVPLGLPVNTPQTDQALTDAAALPLEILILEPNSKRGRVIEEKLLAINLKAKSFSDGDALIEAAQKKQDEIDRKTESPQRKIVVLLDEVRIAGEAGKVEKSLRENILLKDVPIVHVDGKEGRDQSGQDFYLNMPLRRDDLISCLLDVAHQNDSAKTPVQSPNPRVSNARLAAMQAELSEAEPQGPKLTKRILVADDNKINLQVARLFLEALDLSVDVVDDGIAAVTAFKNASYDLVVLDCQMPMLDGFESCRIIKEIQSRKGRRIPVIAMTAHAIAGSKENCLARGFDDYMSKPIEPAELEKIVRFWLGMNDVKITGSHKRFTPPSQDEINERNSSMIAKLSESNTSSGNSGPRRAIDMVLLNSRFNEKNIRSLFQLFLDSYVTEIEELSRYAAAADWPKVKDRAHAFKGACGTICATTIAGFLNDLEKSTASADDNTKLAILEEIKLELSKAVDEVSTYMSQPKP